MATVPFTFSRLISCGDPLVVIWSPLLTDTLDDGAPFDLAGPQRSFFIEVSGTFGGGTLVFQGSVSGSQWAPMRQADGLAASFTSAGAAALLGFPRFVRPLITAGTGGSLTVQMFVALNSANV